MRKKMSATCNLNTEQIDPSPELRGIAYTMSTSSKTISGNNTPKIVYRTTEVICKLVLFN